MPLRWHNSKLQLLVDVNTSACNSFDNDSDSNSLVEIAELQTPVIGDDLLVFAMMLEKTMVSTMLSMQTTLLTLDQMVAYMQQMLELTLEHTTLLITTVTHLSHLLLLQNSKLQLLEMT